MRNRPLYSNNQFESFQLPAIQNYPQTFWEWINSIDWDKLQPYINAGATALLSYLKKQYPTFYSKYGSLIESFVHDWLGGNEPPEPTSNTSDNTMLYILIGVVLIVVLMK